MQLPLSSSHLQKKSHTQNKHKHKHKATPFPNTMALSSSGTHFLYNTSIIPLKPSSPRTLSPFTVSANPKKQNPRTGKFDSKNRKNITTKELGEEDEFNSTVRIDGDEKLMGFEIDDGFVMPELPGDKPDFWEGSKWDGFGFFVQYMWAFGIVFALVSSGIAVATYNEGATDFKETPVYKEAIQSQELLEEPDTPNADVFESNPTEQAPSLE